MISLTLAAMMAITNTTNLSNGAKYETIRYFMSDIEKAESDKAITKYLNTGWRTLQYDVPKQPKEYKLTLGAEALIQYTSKVEVISTNCVIYSEFKPIITQSNGGYVIRFEQTLEDKLVNDFFKNGFAVHSNALDGTTMSNVIRRINQPKTTRKE